VNPNIMWKQLGWLYELAHCKAELFDCDRTRY
jgi:hypothetical protein